MKIYLLLYGFFSLLTSIRAQQRKGDNLVYVDKQGVLRYTKTKKEAAFFGVNYTVPFAYGYRSVKRMGVDAEKAIDEDVYHFSRLGLDAFRVHVWDWEITDSLGNLLENEHLRLFDYLIAKLKARNIKTLVTPIAFWGNGYPERDIPTRSFSNVYGKGPSVVNEKAIQAQENYMKQFFTHVNPYTNLTYGNDADVIAMEINNEPHHSGPKEKTTEYINRLANAVKSTGWTKPIFYNISESPTYADAVAKADVDGHSFQWYPTGLVANRTLKGNYLPNVDVYKIPFGDTIPAYRNRTRMVYEFDAGDVLQSNIYPAMARSFRTAGFQWATQFAYDPMATAYANTEYQTHYVNLAYTPSKAISLLIASKVFHKVPRLKSYGTYPADSAFNVFRVSYKKDLSEMNDDEEFYYSNSTSTQPKNVSKLKHIAGVGSSPIVTYDGLGAYFLDKGEGGTWRLEVMPDAVHIRDPFERASPKKEVTRIQWQENAMQIMLPDLGTDFKVFPLNEGNNYSTMPIGGKFKIHPGTYLITRSANANSGISTNKEFVAPKQKSFDPFVVHLPFKEVTSGRPFEIKTKIVGVDSTARINLEFRNSSNRWRSIPLQKKAGYDFVADVPVDIVSPGVINYRIVVHAPNKETTVFPGNHKGDPYAWDAFANETWETYVAAENTRFEIFNPSTDRSSLNIYNPDWRNSTIEYITGEKPMQLVFKATMNTPTSGSLIGFHSYFADKIKARQTELSAVDKLVVRARAAGSSAVRLRVALINADALSFGTSVDLTTDFRDIEIPLSTLKQDSSLLLPRPYPGFLPLWFKSAASGSFDLAEAEKLEIMFGPAPTETTLSSPVRVEVETVYLRKAK